MMKKITISIPAYNEEENIFVFYEQILIYISKEISNYDFEFIFVNDGSTDKTISLIRELEEIDSRVIGIELSRNYGKEIAMAAGFDHATGDAVITMDADLQHPFSSLKEMVELWEIGYQDVYGKRVARPGESKLKISFSNIYYRILNQMTKEQILSNVGDFRLLDRQVVEALKQMRESTRYTKGLYEWVGFRKIEFQFEAAERFAGETKWKLLDLVKLACEGITSYTTAPLKLSIIFGFMVSSSALFYMIFIVVYTIVTGIPRTGVPTITILILFLGGVQLISLGIIGEYLGRVFIEVKDRPLYFINKKQMKNESDDLSDGADVNDRI
jgi:glycosyltransferase involved in cell wall biosynthesis